MEKIPLKRWRIRLELLGGVWKVIWVEVEATTMAFEDNGWYKYALEKKEWLGIGFLQAKRYEFKNNEN